MTKKQMVQFLSCIMQDILAGRDYEEHADPARVLKELKGSPRINSLTPAELKEKETECSELRNLFWRGHDTMYSGDILMDVFHSMYLPQQDIELLASVMTHGIYNKTPQIIKYSLTDPEMASQLVDALRESDVSNESTQTGKKMGAVLNGNEMELPFPEVEMEGSDISPSPKDIYNELSKYIYKQEDAKKAASILYWQHLNGHHQNSIYLGPSGCGKSEIFRTLKDISDGDVFIFDSSRITQEGWRGGVKFGTLMREVAPKAASGAIVVFDEADKMFESRGYGNEQISYNLQNELLKMIEGDGIDINGKILDTSQISFVFMGSFETLLRRKNHQPKKMGFDEDVRKNNTTYEDKITQDDLIKFAGIRKEIAGRINRIVQLQPMAADDFYQILKTPAMSPIKNLEQEYGKKIVISDKAKHTIASKAAESGLGVRWLHSVIQNALEDKIFENETAEYYILG